ncbi:MAG TPA: acyltransferase [Alphaproteobacteria bacterium]
MSLTTSFPVSASTTIAAPAARKTSRPGVLPSLTPLRGIAALWVILYHFTWQYFPQLNSEPFTQAIAKGYLAVDLFFLLSGFVLTHVYLTSFARRVTPQGYRAFLAARVARIYPLHLFVLALFLLVEIAFARGFPSIPLEGPRSFAAFFANIFMLQGLEAGELSWNYPAWSISLEFIAYLLFPLALPLLWSSARVVRSLVMLVLLAALVWLAQSTEDHLNQWDGPLALLRCLPEFFLGSLAYAIYRSGLLARLFEKDLTLLLAFAGVGLAMHVGAPDLWAVPLFLLLILSAVSNRERAAGFLNVRPLVWLGDVSYSIYLVHGFVQYAMGRLLPAFFGSDDPGLLSFDWSLGLMTGMLVVTFLLSALTYRFVEVRGRSYMRARLKPRAART